MRFARHTVLLTLILTITAVASFGKGEARFHHGHSVNGEMVPNPITMGLHAQGITGAGSDLIDLKRRGPADAPAPNILSISLSSEIIPSAVRHSPQKISKKMKRRQKGKPFRIQAGKRQSLALGLSIFFGVIGVHRFYLGYTGIALIQMLTLGGLGVWFIVDAFRIGFGKLVPISGPYTYRMGKDPSEVETEGE
jgi:hypothetical protein